MKPIDDVCFVVQARLNSERVPRKMISPFAGSNLTKIILEKLLNSKIIPRENIWLSVYERELKNIGSSLGINIFNRSWASANEDGDIGVIYEWHNRLPYKYVILISGCNPLLKISTVDNFTRKYLNSDKNSLFAVFPKKQYYWNSDGELITKWVDGESIMNTKSVETIYEAAHVLYASPMSFISEHKFMADMQNGEKLELFVMDELEAFDIDYKWQFEIAEAIYNYEKI